MTFKFIEIPLMVVFDGGLGYTAPNHFCLLQKKVSVLVMVIFCTML